MRRIGTLTSETSARRFAEYLYTQSIEATVDGNSPPSWDVWIRQEGDVERAKEEFAAFQLAPQDPRFDVTAEAAKMRDEWIARERRRISLHRRGNEPVASGQSEEANESLRPAEAPLGSEPGDRLRQQQIPITIAIIVISVLVSFTTNFGKPRGSAKPGEVTLEQRVYSGLSFVDRAEYARANGDPFVQIRQGQVWRLVTPIFLHGDEFHLAFNMLWIFFLGSAIERLHGSFVFILLVLATQISGMMLQVSIPPLDWIPATLHGTPFAIGASGAVYGLLGFLWVRPMVDHDYPIQLDPTNVVLMMGWLVACMTPLIPGVANGAHLGGLIAGVLAGALGYFVKR